MREGASHNGANAAVAHYTPRTVTALPTNPIELPFVPHEKSNWLRRYVFSTDHKIIGIQFLFFGLAFFVIGGLLAMVIRWQLAWPGDGWVSAQQPGHPIPVLAKWLWPVTDASGTVHGGPMPPEVYNIVFTLHATVMVFFVLIPILVGAFGNYLIPLKIGARDMAFPFLNGLAFWISLVAGVILLTGVSLPGGAAATGWTAYPPISSILFNGQAGTPAVRSALSLLQSPGSTWGTGAIVVNFLAIAMVGGFLVARPTLTDASAGRKLVELILALIASVVLVRLEQLVAFDGQACWFLAIFILGTASVLGAVNYLTTVLTMRCPGMTFFRMPLSVWNLFITAGLVLFATPVLASLMAMNLLDHLRLTSFFTPFDWALSNVPQDVAGGGVALVHIHLFWFYSHPAVYIMILPAMGFVSDILAVFSRKPLFGYRPMVYASVAIALLGFLVWGHHMFQSGMNPTLGTTFAVSTMVIAAPSGIKTFNWLGTLWRGNLRLTVPMLNAMAFVSLFVIGGLSGIFMASSAVDVSLHMTYFIVAHIHYVLFGGSTFGIFAGIYFWYPKMFGRMLNAKLGYIHFWLSYVSFNCTFFAMHILGLQGFPRRVADYRNYTQWAHLQPMNQFISMSAFTLGLAQLPFIVNFIGSWFFGPKAPDNPWEASTLEWACSSPPAAWNFDRIPDGAPRPVRVQRARRPARLDFANGTGAGAERQRSSRGHPAR